MSELLSEARENHITQAPIEFNTWLQCFVSCESDVSQAPGMFMAYIVAIIRAAGDYSSLAWVRYDVAYRRLGEVSQRFM